MPVKTVEGTIVSQTPWNERLYSITLDADIEPFRAGQFGRIGLEIDGEQVMRPYSFVNAPSEFPHEFHYHVLEEGPLTSRLVRMEPGNRVLVAPKPNGFLVLEEVPDAEQLWMLSTGTAVGPFLSILKSGDVWSRFSRVVLVHAVRHLGDLSYSDVAKSLAEKHAERMCYIPIVSREDTGFALRGRVPALLQSGVLQKEAGLEISPEHSQFMLCGNPEMVKDTTEILKGFGFERNRRRQPGHITVENYW